jgi:hypothetical protein
MCTLRLRVVAGPFWKGKAGRQVAHAVMQQRVLESKTKNQGPSQHVCVIGFINTSTIVNHTNDSHRKYMVRGA